MPVENLEPLFALAKRDRELAAALDGAESAAAVVAIAAAHGIHLTVADIHEAASVDARGELSDQALEQPVGDWRPTFFCTGTTPACCS